MPKICPEHSSTSIICAIRSEPLLLAYAISTKNSCAGSFIYISGIDTSAFSRRIGSLFNLFTE